MANGDAPKGPLPNPPAGARILMVEDDERLADLVAEYLEAAGFQVRVHRQGSGAVQAILDWQPDLVLLDLMLPGQDGLSICREVRPQFDGAILMLTSLGDEVEQVVGLEMGADDYVPKPASPRLLLARIRALLRRQAQERSADRVEIGDLLVDRSRFEAHLGGRRLELTTAEFDLLWMLVSNAGKVMSRDELLKGLRGIEYDGLDRSIDVRISKLRQKLGDDPQDPRRIKTIRGVGYLFSPEPP